MFGKKLRELDMTEGSLAKKMLIFTLPLMLSGVLQLLYNAADIIVVGRYSGSVSLAAVGSNSSLVNLLVGMFIGMASGVNVIAAKHYGAKNDKGISLTVHTSILFGLICGVAVGTAGFLTAKKMLIFMGSPSDVIELSTLYLKIYFLGMPGLVVYNFGAALLRAAGDTNRPLIFLMISGVLNVLLNLLFVAVFKMDVAGVALATTISQYVSTALVIICLIRTDAAFKFMPNRMRLNGRTLAGIIKVGLPAGLQAVLFSISNVLIQSTVNSFGSVVMAGNAAAISIENFSYVSMDAVGQSAVTATGQNTGAKKYTNFSRIMKIGILYAAIVGIAWGIIYILFGRELTDIYAPGQPDVIEVGKIRLDIFGYTYFIWGIMNIFIALLRGMGYPIIPTLVSVIGICGVRIVWIYLIFPLHPVLESLYISYPVSWLITLPVVAVCYFIIKMILIKRQRAQITV